MLLSDAFKDEDKGTAPDQIDVEALLCMGLIHCGGSSKEKARFFYGMIQDGGMDAHTFIAAGDKDLPPIFQKVCELATVELFTWVQDITNYECPFGDSFDSLKSCHEDLREDVFLEDIFGTSTKLDNDPWLKNLTEKAKWFFSAKDVRKQVFKQAEVQYKL